jgi:predicted dehydrogenase
MIRIGIVGCGRILAAHLRGYRLLRQAGVDNFRITALCARKESDAVMYIKRGEGPPQRPAVSDIPGDPLAIGDEYLSDFQDDVDVAVYTDYREMISDGPIDAVNDFSTHALHHQVAHCAFEHGKDLLSQKPLAVTVEAARRMCAQAEAKDCVFGVFENFRNSAATRHLRWLFESGRIGRLQMILLGYVGVWWAPNRIVAETPWRHRRLEGGGISLDLGVHFQNQMRYVAGDPVAVSAQTAVLQPERVTLSRDGHVTQSIDCDADDTFMANYEFAGGVVANLFASWAGFGPPIKVGAGTVYLGSAGRVSGPTVDFADGETAELSDLYEQYAGDAHKEQYFPAGVRDSFALNQWDWLRAVQERRPPETSGEEGLRDLAAAYAILEAHQAQRRVEVQEVLDGSLREYQRPIDEAFGLLH